MDARAQADGNGGSQGMLDIVVVSEGCVLFVSNPQHPTPDLYLPAAIAEVMQKWMLSNPVRVRETLPIVKEGNTVALFVWYDRAGP